MGMAASQARLLSITSRMADNELRAQITNNAKMRLAADSSRISADYVNALNNATMMITNYNEAGDSQFNKLTYNRLTQYSPFNTQYGLSNTYGQLLVNENEAAIFEAAGGSLAKYLEAHGLEFDTSYFDPESFNGTTTISFQSGLTDEYGKDLGTFDLADLKAMYMGNTTSDGLKHLGFEANEDIYQSFGNIVSNFSIAYSRCLEDDNLLTNYVNPEIIKQVNAFGKETLDENDIYDTYRKYAAGELDLSAEESKDKIEEMIRLIGDISTNGDGMASEAYVKGATTDYYNRVVSSYMTKNADGQLVLKDIEDFGYQQKTINGKSYYVSENEKPSNMQTIAEMFYSEDSSDAITIDGVKNNKSWDMTSSTSGINPWMNKEGINVNNSYLIKVTDSKYTPNGSADGTYHATQNILLPGYIAISKTTDGVKMLYGQNSSDDELWSYWDNGAFYKQFVKNVTATDKAGKTVDQRGQNDFWTTVEYDNGVVIDLDNSKAIGDNYIVYTGMESETAFNTDPILRKVAAYLAEIELLADLGGEDRKDDQLDNYNNYVAEYKKILVNPDADGDDREVKSDNESKTRAQQLSLLWMYSYLNNITTRMYDLDGTFQADNVKAYVDRLNDDVHDNPISAIFTGNANYGNNNNGLGKLDDYGSPDFQTLATGYEKNVLQWVDKLTNAMEKLCEVLEVPADDSSYTPQGQSKLENVFIFTKGTTYSRNSSGDKEYHQFSWDGTNFCVDPSGMFVSTESVENMQVNDAVTYYAFDGDEGGLVEHTAYSEAQVYMKLLSTLCEDAFGHSSYTADGVQEPETLGNFRYSVNIMDYIDDVKDSNSNAKEACNLKNIIKEKYGIDVSDIDATDFAYIGSYKDQLLKLFQDGQKPGASKKDQEIGKIAGAIYDNYILNCMFDIYGEPNVTWVDKNNPTVDAEAKVNWYTNLFERMSRGYKVLEDGLANSNEWIEYALESGIVTVEQVDKANHWNGTVYSNVATITEVTDEVAVARAEAEYKKAMNEIENKDKRLDIELKNIDTEHSALQTEYESIKSVISKNVERSFKMYNA